MRRRLRASARAGQAGFTVIELSVSLVLLLLALALSAELFTETSQLFAYTSGESLDTPVPLVIARIRGDVQGAVGVVPVLRQDGALDRVVLLGLDRQILYQKRGDSLYRTVAGGKPLVLWRGVTHWSCRVLGSNLVDLEVTYRRRAVPRSPLPGLDRGPATEELTQKMFLLPRGAGLGETW
ncbi:MAG TPA: prepilin-type N-terminal cleavage/methylation domain-containing protein [Thermoanaerobaculia bacterium]|jgi:prepilin-type N-terminal cleavage/methylation domain-containing protein